MVAFLDFAQTRHGCILDYPFKAAINGVFHQARSALRKSQQPTVMKVDHRRRITVVNSQSTRFAQANQDRIRNKKAKRHLQM